MLIENLSAKQVCVMSWWLGCRSATRDGIICDGAVRSGKTVACALGFFIWATARFDGAAFAVCSKTQRAARRNIITPYVPFLRELGYKVNDKVSEEKLTVSDGTRENTFYLFGGQNAASASMIQGLTLAGALFDEVALMPEEFVSQTMVRCSVEGSKWWFNCNPESPQHWFKRGYIDRADERNLLYYHFVMADNPSLAPEILRRYEFQFAGRFYRRFILGMWEAPEGLVYDFMAEGQLARKPPNEPHEAYVISVDYGTSNPSSFGLWGRADGVWYRIGEYWYDARAEGGHKTDSEYADALIELAGGRRVESVVADPSAKSFIEELRRRGLRVTPAVNAVADGIRVTAGLLKSGGIVISPVCREALREFALYRWQNGVDCDKPVKENDHAMDEIRYFAATVAARREAGTAAFGVGRRPAG